jgi:putative addiction module component (TIGR02574 family)
MILDEIKKLSAAERIVLIENIWDTIEPENLTLTDDHKKELDRRLLDLKSGSSKTYTWEQVKNELKQSRL